MADTRNRTRPTTSSLADRLVRSEDGDRSPVLVPIDGREAERFVDRRSHVRQMTELNAMIRRDLLALLGTRRVATDTDLSRWPAVEMSVLNFGIPDLSGQTLESLNLKQLRRELTKVIRRFEPRLHAETVTVMCRIDHRGDGGVMVEIEAVFGPSDAAEAFAMGVTIGLDNGVRTPENVRKAA